MQSTSARCQQDTNKISTRYKTDTNLVERFASSYPLPMTTTVSLSPSADMLTAPAVPVTVGCRRIHDLFLKFEGDSRTATTTATATNGNSTGQRAALKHDCSQPRSQAKVCTPVPRPVLFNVLTNTILIHKQYNVHNGTRRLLIANVTKRGLHADADRNTGTHDIRERLS